MSQYVEAKVVEILGKINVNDKVEKKNGLTYLSWAWAWKVLKENFPTANYIVYENAQGWNYHHDGRTAWVKTGVVVEGIEHIEYLPVMDFRNKSIPLEQITSFDVNKAIQRSLTKAISRHLLAIYIFAGEDLPEDTSKGEIRPQDLPNKNITEKIRENTLFLLDELYGKLPEDVKVGVDQYLKDRNVKGFGELTESIGRALLLNIQKKVDLIEGK